MKEVTTLTHSDRTWPVKLRSYPNAAAFSSGWMAFVRGTRLRVGNVCVFELIDRDDIVFRVYVISSKEIFNAIMSLKVLILTPGRNKWSRCRMNHSEPVFRGPTLPRPLRTTELASEFDLEHPFFKMVIQRSHFRTLRVPGKFVRQHIEENKKTATLTYSDRSWAVNLSRYKRDARVLFSAGWPVFAREAHLRVGNACVFELIDRDDVVFKVSILNNGDEHEIHVD
ncbi:B3 domain-containing protein Os03g0620400-like [Rhodamnia argentea]|uniref:B3 domain-containing protein Os03g0620400-like n=1 Tax=Rhodamnia argentea TaxID=178133 RepID=A0A8B8N6K2_9MYRT|nr:B3 domain-containing protein Os03g0620400-like [Rhodamnia argentea]